MAIAQRLEQVAFRKDPFQLAFRARGYNLSLAAFAFAVRLYPDAPGDPLILVRKAQTRGASGVRVVDTGTDADGIPWTDLEIILRKSLIEALPSAGEAGDDAQFHYDFQWAAPDTASGFSQVENTILFGPFIVKGSINA